MLFDAKEFADREGAIEKAPEEPVKESKPGAPNKNAEAVEEKGAGQAVG